MVTRASLPHGRNIFSARRSDLSDRWDPRYHRIMGEFLTRIQSSPHPVQRLGDFIRFIQYGMSERASDEIRGVPMLRMNNLQDESWDLSDLKYIQIDPIVKSSYMLRDGDLLFNRTNSKELVGKCKVFDIPGEYVFASYLIRVRVDPDQLLPLYIEAFLASAIGRVQIDAISRQIAGMANINASEVRELLIPTPDIRVQARVVATWKAALKSRDAMYRKAEQLVEGIDDALLKGLGVSNPPRLESNSRTRIFTRVHSELARGRRWDPLFYERDMHSFLRGISAPLFTLGSAIEYMRPGFAAGRDDQGDSYNGLIQIRPTNIGTERRLVFDRCIFIDSQSLTDRRDNILQAGEVLFNNTNSQELVGKTAFFDLQGEYCCSNHITRIRTLDDRLNPQFLYYVLNAYQRYRVFYQMCINWSNQSGISSKALRNLLIPIPSLRQQHELVEKLNEFQQHAFELRCNATESFAEAKQEIEAMILAQEKPA